MVTIAVCVPNSLAHPPETLIISAITVSELSAITSSSGVIVTVPVVEPAGIEMVVELAV